MDGQSPAERLAQAQNRLVEELQSSEKRYADLVGNLSEAVFHLDSELCWTFLNKAWQEISGYNVKDTIGSHLSEHITFGTSVFDALLLSNTGELKENFELHCADGSKKTVEVSCRAMKDATGQNSSIVGTLSDISEQLEQQEKIYSMAYHDSLTGLANRRRLIDLLEMYCHQESHQAAALMYFDLNSFKQVNDNFGHAIGDKLLVHTANILEKFTGHDGVVSRLGGDEFIILFQQLPEDKNQANIWLKNLADNILTHLISSIKLSDITLEPSCSIGITSFIGNQLGPEDLLKRADFAMYQAKIEGVNQVRFFNKQMAIQKQQRRDLDLDLRSAIEKHQLIVYYQPQIEISSGKITKAEALIRWQHPDRGLVMPDEFISHLENTGLINIVGEKIIDDCCKLIKQWRHLGHTNLCVSINASPKQFQDKFFVENIAQKLLAYDIPGNTLEIEITEGIAIQNIDETVKKMKQLKQLGVAIALDDFGTGHSSLSHLKLLPIDTLKLDRCFIKNIHNDDYDKAIVESILVMSRLLKLNTVVEGVENSQQLKFLIEHNCQMYQGFYFSKAVSAEHFYSLLTQ
ncbi:EAL domain-containing protein [Marinomonas sp.]|nr:EAL domain-containing protein [Marinomonas sp.]MDB4838093.1 EAL domain-containing protein [Marinomonas sp.]